MDTATIDLITFIEAHRGPLMVQCDVLGGHFVETDKSSILSSIDMLEEENEMPASIGLIVDESGVLWLSKGY